MTVSVWLIVILTPWSVLSVSFWLPRVPVSGGSARVMVYITKPSREALLTEIVLFIPVLGIRVSNEFAMELTC